LISRIKNTRPVLYLLRIVAQFTIDVHYALDVNAQSQKSTVGAVVVGIYAVGRVEVGGNHHHP
jgi:hypothetical protein